MLVLSRKRIAESNSFLHPRKRAQRALPVGLMLENKIACKAILHHREMAPEGPFPYLSRKEAFEASFPMVKHCFTRSLWLL